MPNDFKSTVSSAISDKNFFISSAISELRTCLVLAVINCANRNTSFLCFFIFLLSTCSPFSLRSFKSSHAFALNGIRQVGPVTVGRKNWLFCDTTDGADASMMVFSLLETARANGINPYKYLEFLLESRPDEKMTDEQLESLSPWNENVKQICKINS